MLNVFSCSFPFLVAFHYTCSPDSSERSEGLSVKSPFARQISKFGYHDLTNLEKRTEVK